MDKSVIIKKSKLNKNGIFAKRDFKKGEIVLRWKPKVLGKDEVEKLFQREKHYIVKIKGKYLMMRSPEKYVNHSCDPNTRAKKNSDVAMRNIRAGEEITSDYNNSGIISFKCKCGSKKCKKIIN
jgi:SET domain-containing protein